MKILWIVPMIFLLASCVPLSTVEKVIVVSSEDGLVVFDVSDPSDPVRIGGFDVDQDILNSFDTLDSRVYLAHGESGVTVLDLSKPENPEILQNINTYNAMDVRVIDNVAYIADLSNGVLIVDVSDLDNPEILSNISGVALYVHFQDDRLFVMNTNTVEIFDVSDSRNPKHLSSLNVKDSTWIHLSGNTLYVLTKSGLFIYDLSDEYNPVFLSKKNLPHLSEPRKGILDDDKIYTWDYDKLITLDVSDPENPEEVDELHPEVGPISGVYKSGNTLYIVGDGLSIVDLESGEIIGRSEISKEDVYAAVLWIDEQHAFVGSDKLVVFDISHPASPQAVGYYDEDNAFFQSIFVQDDTLYGALNSTELKIIDISDPEFPTLLRTLEFERPVSFVLGTSDTIYVSGNQEFAALDANTFQVLDEKFIPGNAMNFQIVENRIFLNTGFKIHVLDVSDPSNIKFEGDFKAPSYTYSTAYKDGYLYLVSQNGLVVMDVSDPSNPVEIRSLDVENAREIWIEGNRLYLARRGNGISILDISNPGNPWIVGEFDTDGEALSIRVEESRAYVADAFNGLVVLDVSDPSDIELIHENDVNAYRYTGVHGM